jgi:hypothetical protein
VKKWDAPPKVGDLVFYRGERMFVEIAPVSFLDSVWVRIGDHRVPIDERTHEIRRSADGHSMLTEKRISFYVHADEISAVPGNYNSLAARLPTVASLARAQRAKAGVRDVGDAVATMLRSCDTLERVYAAGAEYLGVPVAELKAKYERLNPGQQRMNIGNRMRAKWRKEHV